jgi:hypothetical protein
MNPTKGAAMKFPEPTTLAVLEVIADHKADERLKAGEIAKLLRGRGGLRRLENPASVAMRIAALEKRGLVLTVGKPKAVFATMRGYDVADGGLQCRVCGCTENDACEDGCCWVEASLCSSCVLVEVEA